MVKDHSDSKREREKTCCHMVYSFQLAARVLLNASSHRQDNTYHSLWYTSHGALAGTRNSKRLSRSECVIKASAPVYSDGLPHFGGVQSFAQEERDVAPW